jgi:hypothetical protein
LVPKVPQSHKTTLTIDIIYTIYLIISILSLNNNCGTFIKFCGIFVGFVELFFFVPSKKTMFPQVPMVCGTLKS